MDALLQDLRYSFRTLARSPGFTAVAVACLALGIGVNTAVFSMVNALVLRPFPFPDPDAVVSVYASNDALGWREASASAPDLLEWKQGAPAIGELAAISRGSFVVAGGQEAEQVTGFRVTPNLFGIIGARPALGRVFGPAEGAEGNDRVVVLGNGLWTRRFGGRTDVVGSTVLVNGRPHTVIGVMPPRFRFPETSELWVPTELRPGTARDARGLQGIGRLRAGATPQQADAQVRAVAARLAASHPETNRGWGAKVLSFRDDMVDGELRTMLWLMLGAVGFVLLIACANVANLLLARAAGRQREVAIRAALGAGAWRIVRQLLVEAVLVALAGGVVGIALASAWLRWTVAWIPEELPYWIRFKIDGRVLLFTLGLSVATGILFGLLPALRARSGDLRGALSAGGRGVEGGVRGSRLRSTLVGAEMALAVVLLAGAALMVRSFLAITAADAGFETDRLLTMRTQLSGPRYDSIPARAAFHAEAVRRLTDLPGVAEAVATTTIPTDDGGEPYPIAAEGDARPRGEEIVANVTASTPGLFRTLGVPMQEGRDFSAAEAADTAARVAVIGRTLAATLWPGGSALGKRVRVDLDGGPAWVTVVGVAGDLQYEEFGEETRVSRLQLHLPWARLGWRSAAYMLRTEGSPAALAQPARRTLRGLDATLPAFDVRTMDEVRRYTTWPSRLWGTTFGVFAAIALGLAALGIYGVMSYSVSQRVREIGIRMALGARAGDVVRSMVTDGARPAVIGMAIGLVAAVAVTRLLAGFLYGVTAADATAFVLAPAVLLGSALLAAWLPARRAARVDPMAALRGD